MIEIGPNLLFAIGIVTFFTSITTIFWLFDK